MSLLTASRIRRGPARRTPQSRPNGADPIPPPSPRVTRGTVLLAAAVTVLAVIPRVLTALSQSITADEPLWMTRSEGFSDAITSADLGGASAYQGLGHTVTMPGVTTMWIGSLARAIWAIGRSVGLVETDGDPFRYSPQGLNIAQVLVALATSLLVGLIVVLVALWTDRITAAITGVLLACEPFVVANGAVLHTDELMTLLVVAGLVATALTLGIPRATPLAHRKGMALLTGLLFGAAWLTKITAVIFLPSVVLLVAWAAWRDRPPEQQLSLAEIVRHLSPRRLRHAPGTRLAAWGALAFVGLVVLTYPALWADPINESYWLVRSFSQGVRGHTHYFLGQVKDTPGPLYYLVALPMRMSPWFLVTTVVASIAVWHRSTRSFAVPLALMAAPPALLLSVASKQFDRYGLPLLGVAGIAIGLVVSRAVRSTAVASRPPRQRALVVLGAGGVLAAELYAAAVAPWGMTYFNPALGGSATAQDNLTVGWGEGFNRAIDYIVEREGPGCGDATILMARWASLALPIYGCRPPRDGVPATYSLVYINERQRWGPRFLEEVTGGRQLLSTVEIRGLTIVEIYGPVAPDRS